MALSKNFDLDVDAPNKVPLTLRRAADSFYESAADLTAAWRDKGAGRPWDIIAKELEAAADRIDKKLKAIGF